MKISPVRTRDDLNRFLRLPWSIYEGNPHWVPPLLRDVELMLDRKRNPFFETSKAEYFLACDEEGRVIGRIAAARFEAHLSTYGDGTGFFGFFECVDDKAVASALFEAAADWLRGQGLRRMRGPASFTINDEVGLLIDGFERSPRVLMAYNPPYYRELLESAGFVKAQDLYSYELTEDPKALPLLARYGRLVARQKEFTIRQVVMKRFADETEVFEKVFAEAWEENWGAVPLRPGELRKAAADLKPFMRPELVLIGEYKGEPVGVLFALPDLNQALRKANGRLLPFGLVRMLLERSRIRRGRVILMGVLKEYRRRGLEIMMIHSLAQALLSIGYTSMDLGWVLESNIEMNAIPARAGLPRVTTHRIYDRDL